jgi:cell wall assembly regulator SMI1
MTMHLEGPWLSTTGKRKGKQKFRTAEQAQKARQLKEDWQDLLKRHGIEQEEKRKQRGLKAPIYTAPKIPPYRRETPYIPSLNSNIGNGIAIKTEPKIYTGDAMLGVATMHKSNSVPVFSAESATDISKMRR